MLEYPRSLHHSRGTRREAACRPTLQRIRAVVNPEAVAEEIKQGGQAGVFFAFSISFSVLFQVMAHIMHTLRALRLPHCFRILHHGVTSAVLNSLKKQHFHLASSTQAKPYSSSRERAMGIDPRESLAKAS